MEELSKISKILKINLDSIIKIDEPVTFSDSNFEFKTLIIEKINNFLKLMDEDSLKRIAKICEDEIDV